MDSADGLEAAAGGHAVVQRLSTGGPPTRLDPDVASLSLSIDHHMQALTKDAVDQLLAVKARMIASMETAVAEENQDGNMRLTAKQAEVDAVNAQLQHTQQLLGTSETLLERVAGGYSSKQQAVHERLNLLRCWYQWREWAHKERRLQYLGLRLQQFYVRRWLLGRAWDRWLAQARLQYRTLVAERAEKQQKADAAALHAIHAKEAAALRAEIEGLQLKLQDEAQARNKMEEEMKRAFMRGVTAINLEALQMMRRGAPPSGANPFPVTLPLTASTAAAGLVAAAGSQQQSLAHGPTGPDLAAQDSAAAGAAADSSCAVEQPLLTAATGGCSLGSILQDLVKLPTQHLQEATGRSSTAAVMDPLLGTHNTPTAHARSWSQSDAAALQPALLGPVLDTSMQPACSLSAVTQHQAASQQQAGVWPGRSQQQLSPACGSGTRVFIERGPARTLQAAAPVSPAQKPPVASSPGTGRSVGVRRSMTQAAGKASQLHQSR